MSTEIEAHNPDLNRKLARIVASAWIDPDYKKLVLEAPKKTFEEAGVELPADVHLTVVEDTPKHLNVILANKELPPQNRVTTLPAHPDFYSVYSYVYSQSLKDAAFKESFLANPVGTFRELGAALPEDTTISVYEDTATNRYFTLPTTPKSRIAVSLNENNVAVLSVTTTTTTVNANAAINVDAAVNVLLVAAATVAVAVAVLG